MILMRMLAGILKQNLFLETIPVSAGWAAMNLLFTLKTSSKSGERLKRRFKSFLREITPKKNGCTWSKEPTASVGVAFVPESGSTFVDVYRAADQALYHVKNSTKNGMAFYDFVIIFPIEKNHHIL